MSPLHGERDYADVNKLRILRWRNILHYSVSGIHIRADRPNLITTVLIREKAMWRWKQIKDATLLALKMEEGPWAKEYKSTVVEARKGKERKFPLDLLENLGFSPMKHTLDFWPPEQGDNKFVLF